MANKKRKARRSDSPPAAAENRGLKRNRLGYAMASPETRKGPLTLPTADDWAFRLKVVCLNPADDLLTDAVKGLVNICFPGGLLEDLGVDVVQRHMEEAGALPESIERTRDAFRTEMVQRVAWLLAPYLDTPQKFDRGLAALTAASHHLHDMHDSGSESGKIQEASADVERPEPEETKQEVNSAPESRKRDPNKVSKSWRWDVKPADISPTDIPKCFKKILDLFAYHALPNVRRDLGPGASNAEIEHKIERIWHLMSDDERVKCTDSFQKLQRGDCEMLKHVSQVRDLDPVALQTPKIDRAELGKHRIKREGSPHLDMADGRPIPIAIDDDFADNVSAFGQLSADRPNSFLGSEIPQPRNEKLVDQNTDTPLMDLLWGEQQITTGCEGPILHTLMDELERRTKTRELTFTYPKGIGWILDEQGLRHLVKDVMTRVNDSSRRRRIEEAIAPWLGIYPFSFPELARDPSILLYLKPDSTAALELCVPSGLQILQKKAYSGTDPRFFRYLQSKGIDMTSHLPSARRSRFMANLTGILNRCYHHDILRVAMLERLYRRIILDHREKFPELKDSTLVTLWENVTSLQW